MDRVDVALATYKGARFLPEFLQSVAAQSHAAVRLVASDDNSPDETFELLTAFQPERTVAVRNDGPRGFRGNFANAITHSDAPYVALADQDDVWVEDKISTLLARMKTAEARFGPDVPIIVCSDLAVVSEDLQPLRASFHARWRHPVQTLTFADLTLGNRVPGCSMLLNRALIDRAMPMPDTILFHDWWFMLVAAALGRFEVVEQPLILYRQHGGNQVGDMHRQMTAWERVATKLRAPLTHLRTRATVFRGFTGDRVATLKAFDERFGAQLPGEHARVLRAMLHPGLVRKMWTMRAARAPFGRVFKLMSLYFTNELVRGEGADTPA